MAIRARGLDLYTDFPFSDLVTQDSFVADAEALGYSGVWAAENRHDPFLMIATAATRRRSIMLGTGVIALLSRSPFNTAQMAWDLHYNSNEHFVLGVSTQTDAHLIGRLGVAADDKHGRLRESIRLIREIWSCWAEDRQPVFNGQYYTIHVCPPGYRPTTKVSTVPKIYVLCSTLEDLALAREEADGIFVHPTWTTKYLENILPGDTRSFPVISGGVIATGTTVEEYIRSKKHAQWRMTDYWTKSRYDYVYDEMGIIEPIERFRRDHENGQVRWEDDHVAELYKDFVCDAEIEKLPDALKEHHPSSVTGVFPNIMSLIPRLMPAEIVAAVREGS